MVKRYHVDVFIVLYFSSSQWSSILFYSNHSLARLDSFFYNLFVTANIDLIVSILHKIYFQRKDFKPHKRSILLLNMAICPQSTQRTWWPVVSTTIVTASHWLPRYPWWADSRLAPSQWETSIQSNAVSYWLSAYLKSALFKLSVVPSLHRRHQGAGGDQCCLSAECWHASDYLHAMSIYYM